VMAGAVWFARRSAGPIGGVVAGGVLAVSPVFLDNSRLAFVEVPSIAPTVLGMIALVLFRDSGRRGWLVASAVLMAVGALAKPMAGITGLPALLLILAPTLSVSADGPIPGRPFRQRLVDLALFTATGLFVCALVVMAVGP